MNFIWKKIYTVIIILCVLSIFLGVLGGATYHKLKTKGLACDSAPVYHLYM